MIERRYVLAIAVVTTFAASSLALGEQVRSNERESPVNFTLQFAQKLRGFHSIQDLRSAAKSAGKSSPDGDGTSYHWVGLGGPSTSYMLATERPGRPIAVSILTDDGVEIIQNSAGLFVCEPVDCRRKSP